MSRTRAPSMPGLGHFHEKWRALVTVTALFSSIALCEAQSAALSIPVDTTKWLGNDGTWSPVMLQIGSPVQAVDLFPSTAGQETIVIGLNGCDGTIECEARRGGLFASNESSTFQGAAGYNLGLDPNLGYGGAGYYGFDNMSIGNTVTLNDQLLAIVNATEYWTGILGLGSSNTTLGYDTAPSFLDKLASDNETRIPSLSYGYTAGAHYRLKQVPASLTLGGYDANRFEPNDATFALDSNQQPTLAINSITISGADNDNTSMIGKEYQALFTIDSTTPFLWLPETAANILGDSLGLVYNDTLDVFLYPNSSAYEALAQSDLSFTFTFANTPGEPDALSLTVLGQAFTTMNLSFGFPGLSESSSEVSIPYFPVRKAANETQFVLGRAFLQEAYLIVDYQRSNFSLSQASFSLDAATNLALVNIEPPDAPPAATEGLSLTTGAIIGVAIGVVIVSTLIICTIAICLMRRRYAKKVIMLHPGDPTPPGRTGIARLLLGEQRIAELPAREFDPTDKADSITGVGHEYYADKKFPVSEVSDTEIRELPTPGSIAVELPGSPVFSDHKRFRAAQRPAELPDRMSDDSGLKSGPVTPSVSTGGTGTYLTVSGFSSDGRPSPTSPTGLSSTSTRSGSARSLTSLVSKDSPSPGTTGHSGPLSPTQISSGRDSGVRGSRASRQSLLSRRRDTQYTIDDSVSVAFDPRQLRDAPKATRRRFSFEDDSDDE